MKCRVTIYRHDSAGRDIVEISEVEIADPTAQLCTEALRAERAGQPITAMSLRELSAEKQEDSHAMARK